MAKVFLICGKLCCGKSVYAKQRSRSVLSEDTTAYFVDDNLAEKFHALFEVPDAEEIDVWVNE